MQIEPHITFRGMEPSAAVDARIRERIAQLGQFHHRITACRVTVEAPHRHSHQGRIYRVGVDVVVPEGEVIVNHERGLDHAHEDVYVALRDAFDAVERHLTRTTEELSPRHVRHGDAAQHGNVVRLFADEGYGFIATANGDEIYFHRDAVNPEGWRRLEVGSRVRFRASEGDKGRHARKVVVE